MLYHMRLICQLSAEKLFPDWRVVAPLLSCAMCYVVPALINGWGLLRLTVKVSIL